MRKSPSGPKVVEVTILGSGDAFASHGRFQSGYIIESPDCRILMEAGPTALCAMKRMDFKPADIDMILVSHPHGDHFGGLPFLILDGQFSRRERPLTVAGPPGTGERLRQALEALFPGSSAIRRRFPVDVVELTPGGVAAVNGIEVTIWEVDHPSGAPPLAMRLRVEGTTIAYTGDTAWTESLPLAADGADLLIAEAYSYDKAIPYHLRYVDLLTHRADLTSRRIVLTHMSADMLARADLIFETAHDGLLVPV